MLSRPPLPPFTRQTAIEKARIAEDGWNSRDPERVSPAYSTDSYWRNRGESLTGRTKIVEFLSRKWVRDRRTTDRLIPHTIFIDPELGQVGLTEKDVVHRSLNVKVASVPTAAVPRAGTRAETRGFLKAVVDAKSDQILGFAMLGAHAGEVTSVVQMAMLGKQPFTALRDGVLSHPTMAEGLNYLFNSFRPPTFEGRSPHPHH